MGKVAICEACKVEPATSMSVVNGKWIVAGACTRDRETYYIMLDQFSRSPVGWIGHMAEKTWFDPVDFVWMMRRLRDETGAST